MQPFRFQPSSQQYYVPPPAEHASQPSFACPHPACRDYTSRPTTFRPRNSITQAGNMAQVTSASEVQNMSEISQPFHYSPPTSAPYIAYDCHCAQCTQHAETGWSTFIDQGVTGPWQYHAEPSKLFYPFGTGPVYHPQHLGYGAIDHTRQSIRGAEHFEATEALRDQDTMSREAEQPALVAPSEVFYRHSPVPTLSECSTRSTSSSLKSSFGSMGWDEGPVLHSVPASSRPWDSFEPDNLYGRTPASRPPPLEAPVPQRSYAHTLAATQSFFDTPDSSYAFRSPSYTPEPDEEDHTTHSQQADFTERDELLVRWKLQGMSYKDIKAKGGFKEAESTLRGRFRALTKDKQQRVRKPRWTKRDVRLLREGVNKLSVPVVTHNPAAFKTSTIGNNTRKGKPAGSQLKRDVKLRTPWKDVAKYIIDNGGTYHYGNATCRKKWDEVVALEGHVGRSQPRVIELSDDDADGEQDEVEENDGDETEVDADAL